LVIKQVGAARLAGGGWGVAFLTRLRGASNARAREVLGWRPRYPDWSEGFQAELDRDPPRSAKYSHDD
jgi:hypothetical protein